jgi:hypothetical protein
MTKIVIGGEIGHDVAVGPQARHRAGAIHIGPRADTDDGQPQRGRG